MASRGKKKTTMAKLTREARLRERRVEKAARKEARRFAAVSEPQSEVPPTGDEDGLEPAQDAAPESDVSRVSSGTEAS